MKKTTYHTHAIGRGLSVLFFLAGTLQLSAQNEDETKLQINADAVKMIVFDFNGDPSMQEESPRQAPVEKKWMNFREDLRMPRNMTDTAKLWKPTGYFRFEPYTIWTKLGEDPIYDKLVMGRLKKLEFSWTLNPNASHHDEGYGRNALPSTGRMYQGATGSAGVGATIAGLDFIGFIYHNFTGHGRMLAHNRKHANAWKTYKDYIPTKEDSLKVPNFYLKSSLPVYAPDSTDTIALPSPSDVRVPVHHADTKESSSAENEGNLYELIRLKQAEDSIRLQKKTRTNDARTNPYDIQRQIRRLREMGD